MPSHLVETGTRYYLSEKLYSCYKNQYFYRNLFFNITLVMSVIVIIGLLLLYARNRKKDVSDKDLKREEERSKQEHLRILMEAQHAYETHKQQQSELLSVQPWEPLLPTT